MTDKRQATLGHQYPCFAATVKRPARCAPPTGPPRRSARWKAGRPACAASSPPARRPRAPARRRLCALPAQARRPGAPAGADGRLWRRRRAGAAAIAGRQCDGAVELRVKWAAGACAASTSSYEKDKNHARPPQQKSGGRGAGQAGTPRNGLGPAAGVVPWGKTPQAAQGGQFFSSRRSAARSTGLRK